MTDAERLKSMKREEVQALAKKMGVNAGGKTEEIIARIQAAEAAQDAQEGQDAAAGQEGTAEAAQDAQEGQDAAAGQEGTAEAAQDAQEGQDAAAGQDTEAEAAQETAEELVTVKVIEKFFDLQLNQTKEKGEAYQVKKERAAELVAARVAEIEK